MLFGQMSRCLRTEPGGGSVGSGSDRDPHGTDWAHGVVRLHLLGLHILYFGNLDVTDVGGLSESYGGGTQ